MTEKERLEVNMTTLDRPLQTSSREPGGERMKLNVQDYRDARERGSACSAGCAGVPSGIPRTQ